MTKRIKLLETRSGSEDGFAIKYFHEGQSYDVADLLAHEFLWRGYAYLDEPDEEVASGDEAI